MSFAKLCCPSYPKIVTANLCGMHYVKFRQSGGRFLNGTMYGRHLFGSKQNKSFQNKCQFTDLGKG